MPEIDPEWTEAFSFARINRADYVLEDWPADDAEAAVERLALAITGEYLVRRKLPWRHPDYVRPKNWLKPVCYHAIQTCLRLELFEALEARIAKFHRLLRGPSRERSVFMIGIMGIIAHDLSGSGAEGELPKSIIDERERKRMADEMWWGFRHYIAPSELASFNRKFPLHRAKPQPHKDHVEQELYDLVIDRRGSPKMLPGDIEHERGWYPDEIEVAADLKSKERWQAILEMRQSEDDNWE